jgi:RHS repeat-associated protein
LISLKSAGVFSYIGADALGSVRVLLDSTGSISSGAEWDYDAYGNRVNSPNTTIDCPFGFAGEYSELGMIYLRARYYYAPLGRFWNRDSFEGVISKPTTRHPYFYCSADPINHVDPSGNIEMTIGSVSAALSIGAVMGAIGGAAYDHAMGNAITKLSIIQGAETGALFGLGIFVTPVATGLALGGVLIGASGLPVLLDPGASVSRKVAAIGLFLASTYGAAEGLRFARAAGPAPKSPIPESYINPKLVVDMRKAPNGASNAAGYPRNRVWFWNEMLRENMDLFSDANRDLIARGFSPRVDEQWIAHFPQHQAFKGERLIHHHIDQGPIATPIPESVHRAWHGTLHPD